MLDDLDSYDDIPLPTTTTTERRPGKFGPRARAKTANVASTTPKNSDAAQLVPPSPQPLAQDSDFSLEMERTGHEPGLSNYSVVAESRELGQMLASACVPLMAPQVLQLALAEFSTMESAQYTGGTTGVRRAGKFQPENISQPNKGTAKSVSFISSEASDSVIPSVGSFSETMDISCVQMMTDVHEDDPLHSVSTIPDCIAGFQMDHLRVGKEICPILNLLEPLNPTLVCVGPLRTYAVGIDGMNIIDCGTHSQPKVELIYC
ncbi:hypothetical protein C4D60_Mb04t14700 [Musa balbisiana]|uniref:Uncharacterized protein n=1 Tax=Musa balbisiana TaxID=52838 RepID=A0A4S8KC28_MUSBA|nr:hypothetical protein C4D60_Mb04t14700 [Musa balbisiana]